MDRKQFLKVAVIAGGASLFLNTLPYNETFLEPYMDAETLHLHHDFHHSGAVNFAAYLGQETKCWEADVLTTFP